MSHDDGPRWTEITISARPTKTNITYNESLTSPASNVLKAKIINANGHQAIVHNSARFGNEPPTLSSYHPKPCLIHQAKVQQIIAFLIQGYPFCGFKSKRK